MLCIIPGTNIKIFAKAIHALSKIGDEIYFEAAEDGLAVKTVNSTRSAFATFFFKNSFFLKYQHQLSPNCEDEVENETSNHEKDQNNFKCKIYTKSCLTVFKGVSNIDKLVDRCKISLDLDADRFVFTLFCRYGMVKTFKLTFSECEKLKAIFNTDNCINSVKAHTKLLSDVVGNFQANVDEMRVSIMPYCVSFQNVVDPDQEGSGGCVKTEVVIHENEFEEYSFNNETTSVFCLKEFRAFLFFCELANPEVSLYAKEAGKPIIFSLDSDSTFECQLVLATVSSEHLNATSKENKSKTTKRQTKNRSETTKDTSKVELDEEIDNNETHHEMKDEADRTNTNEDDDRGKQNDDDDEQNDNIINKSDNFNTTGNDNNLNNSQKIIDNNSNNKNSKNNINNENDKSLLNRDGEMSRRVVMGENDGDVEVGDSMDDESPPKSPPNKKVRSIFSGLSQSPQHHSFHNMASDSESE